MPNQFFSSENARPNCENTLNNTRSMGLTIFDNGIYFQERRLFPARTATIFDVFLSNSRNMYHMEDPIYHTVWLFNISMENFP
jgi:hypothetical protein